MKKFLETQERDLRSVIITPTESSSSYWREIWQFRELFLLLVWRDVLVRYKQAFFGILWALIRPLSVMLLLTFVFSRVAKLEVTGAPYALFVLAAMLPWGLFSSALSEGANSLITNSSLVTKVYCPRGLVVLSVMGAALLDFGIGLILFMSLLFFFEVSSTGNLLLLPVGFFLCLILTAGAVLWTSALNVRYRDFRYVVPFLLQFGLYASPVGYSIAEVPTAWVTTYCFNPLVGIIECFRNAFFVGAESRVLLTSVLLSLFISTLTLVTGAFYFRSVERQFADEI